MQNLVLEDVLREDAILKSMVTDLSGGLREIIFPISVLKELISTGIAYDGSSFQGINDISASDAILKGDVETLVRVDPSIQDIDKTEYWIMCDIYDVEGNPHPNCARSKLKKMQGDLAKMWEGGNLMMGSEPEAFFVENKENIGSANGGNSNYFNPKDPKSFLIAEIARVLTNMDFKIERAHAEVGDEQFEINWEFDRAERTADRIQLFKLISHKVARNYGFDVTFLPKPYPTRNGSGMHCHLSVGNGSQNLFFDENAKDKKYFSKKALQFLTGILKSSRSLAAMTNRSEVSYARLVPGYEAPCVIAIGSCNRTAACRIPAVSDPAVLKKAIRAEMRYPDPVANPYLVAIGFIAAGMIGLEEEVSFIGFTDENLYKLTPTEIWDKGFQFLPRNLWEAYLEFMNDKKLKAKLGDRLHSTYGDLVLEEIDACQMYANPESARRHYFD